MFTIYVKSTQKTPYIPSTILSLSYPFILRFVFRQTFCNNNAQRITNATYTQQHKYNQPCLSIDKPNQKHHIQKSKPWDVTNPEYNQSTK